MSSARTQLETPDAGSLESMLGTRGAARNDRVLVSLVVIAPGGAALDRDDVARQAEHLCAGYVFSEILIVVSEAGEEAQAAMQRLCAIVAQTRLVQVDGPSSFDDLAIVGYREAIGDSIVVTSSDELAHIDLDPLLAKLHAGDRLVRLRRRRGDLFERAGSRLIQLLTGLKVDTRYMRTLGLNRELLSELLAQPEHIQMFRFRTNALESRQTVIEVDKPKTRRGLDLVVHRIDLVTRLVSVAAPRLLRFTGALCALLSIASLAFLLYTIAVWLFIEDVAQGWTSLSLVLGTWMAIQMAAAAAICLGLSRVIDRQMGQRASRILRDVSAGELFGQGRMLNVEEVEARE